MSKDLEVKTPRANLSAIGLMALNEPTEVCQMLIDDAPLLESEDEALYKLIYRTVVDECKPQSFLDLIEVKDYVDKLWEEQRYKKSIADVIDCERNKWADSARRFLPKKKRDDKRQATAYLPLLSAIQGLSRLADNSGAVRRKLHKELSQKKRNQNKNDPPLIPSKERPN
jgi:hypothetical protein